MPIAQFPFEGPLASLDNIENESGVYAIICEFVDKFYLLDVGQSKNIKEKIVNHERKKCWERFQKGKIRYAVLYSDDYRDMSENNIVKSIRSSYKGIPCGAEI
jgi:hypothetical protein